MSEVLLQIDGKEVRATEGASIQAQGGPEEDGVGTQALMGTAFTYQGYLEERGMPANGIYNFSFEIFDAEVEGESWGGFEATHVDT